LKKGIEFLQGGDGGARRTQWLVAIYVHMLCVGVSCPVIQVTHFPRVNHAATVAGGSKVSRNNESTKSATFQSMKNDHFYQDRLGTNAREQLNNQVDYFWCQCIHPPHTQLATTAMACAVSCFGIGGAVGNTLGGVVIEIWVRDPRRFILLVQFLSLFSWRKDPLPRQARDKKRLLLRERFFKTVS
jgi:hypothetical protein